MNKVILLFLILSFPLWSNATSIQVGRNVYVTNIDGTAMLIECKKPSMVSYEWCDITIPDTIDYEGKEYAVISIGGGAFYGFKDLRTIKIPSTVISIGSRAFMECSGLSSVDLGGGLEVICDYAFIGCI